MVYNILMLYWLLSLVCNHDWQTLQSTGALTRQTNILSLFPQEKMICRKCKKVIDLCEHIRRKKY